MDTDGYYIVGPNGPQLLEFCAYLLRKKHVVQTVFMVLWWAMAFLTTVLTLAAFVLHGAQGLTAAIFACVALVVTTGLIVLHTLMKNNKLFVEAHRRLTQEATKQLPDDQVHAATLISNDFCARVRQVVGSINKTFTDFDRLMDWAAHHRYNEIARLVRSQPDTHADWFACSVTDIYHAYLRWGA